MQEPSWTKPHDCTVERYILDLSKVKPEHYPKHFPENFPKQIPCCKSRYDLDFDVLEHEMPEWFGFFLKQREAFLFSGRPAFLPLGFRAKELPVGAAVIRVTG